MITTFLALLLSMLPLQVAQNLPPAFPRDGAKQLIDNERVTVWDVTWETGKTTPTYRAALDEVIVDLADGTVKVNAFKGATATPSNVTVRKGMASFVNNGAVQSEESVGSTPRHAIVIDLKNAKVTTLVNKSGYPEAFPREGAKKVLDNPRLTVWDFSWTPGKASEMHFHSKDVLVVYLDNGELASTTPDGKTTVNTSTFGQAKFNPRDRTHNETLVKGAQRVIAVELK